DVVYNGANEEYRPVSESEQQEIRNKYTGGAPYFLFVSTIHQRKNVANLFRAFDLFRKKTASAYKLVLAGHKKWMSEEITNAYNNMQFKDDVVFLGRVPSDELKKVTGSALAMTYVSFFEGFGVPVLESMYCDVPVITSNITSMPEVAGDAALLADPFSVESISDAMLKVSSDVALRNKLIENGRVQRQQFTWDKTAERLWQSIENV
ncbi:MAG TPA: glycosyltransferase family 1 protein, partial [Cytophagaceae bacterium]